jgi:hypothetical protein
VPRAVRFKQPKPGAAALLPQHQLARLEPGDPVGGVGRCLAAHGHPVTDLKVLELREDLLGAGPAEVVEQVVAVKTRPVPAPLHQQGQMSSSRAAMVTARVAFR